jgi:hypothetical protein
LGLKLGLSHSREEHRLGVSGTVLRKICGTKREQGTGDWRKLHNEELLVLTKYF